jgi:hypothetical protein
MLKSPENVVIMNSGKAAHEWSGQQNGATEPRDETAANVALHSAVERIMGTVTIVPTALAALPPIPWIARRYGTSCEIYIVLIIYTPDARSYNQYI